MSRWKLNDDEWGILRSILEPSDSKSRTRGRPRIENLRPIAEACLFRSYHSLSTGRSHSFDWNSLPPEFGISPSTANRRFREWSDSGDWPKFWAALSKLRDPRKRIRPRRPRRSSSYPVSSLLAELERAYHFFNDVLFGGVLPQQVAINVLRGAGPNRSLGYFCGRAWRWGTGMAVDLIAVSGLAIERGPQEALGTLIHEMVHHRNDRFNIIDCTNRGLYHNRHYRDSAVLAGLVCENRHITLGYGVTHLGERGQWAIDRLRPEAKLFQIVDPNPPGDPIAKP